MPGSRCPVKTRRGLALIAAVGLAALAGGGAHAGDAAARRIIGFSPDGAYFAFEQYGTLDWSDTGSGWSEIDIIDTRTDRFAAGTPIRVVDESEDSMLTVDQARARAATQAEPLLAKLAIGQRGERTGFDRFTFPDDNVAYNDIPRLEQAAQRWLPSIYDEAGISTIHLDQILADSPADCSASFDTGQGGDATQAGDTNGKALGFRLTLLGQDGQALKVLHEDKAVPASRNCPTSYSLSEAYEFKPDGKPTAVAVLVQRFSQGYEGPDRRFMAVTGQLP